MKEKYVLDHGTADELMIYVDRESDKIELIKEYYSPKSPEKVRIIKLSTFKRIAKEIIYSGDYFSTKEFLKDIKIPKERDKNGKLDFNIRTWSE